MFQFPLHRDPRCNDTGPICCGTVAIVSVPFTSGSSLQLDAFYRHWLAFIGFSSLYIGILAATGHDDYTPFAFWFQFPLHRDPRCNLKRHHPGPKFVWLFQFPLHRDPRCNLIKEPVQRSEQSTQFQFPLHRDPRCNGYFLRPVLLFHLFQFPLHRDPRCNMQDAIYGVVF